jgi:hypothetical protein
MPVSFFKIIQINLRHSAAAYDALSHLLIERNFDIALIQEPYVSGKSLSPRPNSPAGYSAFLDLNTDHAFGALILVKSAKAYFIL